MQPQAMSQPMIVLLFALSIAGQFLGLLFLPASRGFTALWPTVGCIAGFIFSVALSARMIRAGVGLSVLTPIGTVAIQLCAIGVGVAIYGENASPTRLAMLVGAGAMIGFSTLFA